MFQSAIARSGNRAEGGQRLEPRKKSSHEDCRMALYDRRCTNQAEAALSDNINLKNY